MIRRNVLKKKAKNIITIGNPKVVLNCQIKAKSMFNADSINIERITSFCSCLFHRKNGLLYSEILFWGTFNLIDSKSFLKLK
jgi:hypothetical protein